MNDQTEPAAAADQVVPLIPDTLDFEGVELAATHSAADGALRAYLGSALSGIPSITETIMVAAEENPDTDIHDLIREMDELLSAHIQLGHADHSRPDALLEDASRYYELLSAGWYLTAQTGLAEGGLIIHITFKGSICDTAALRFLAADAGISISEMMRRLIRGAFAVRHLAGLVETSREFRTAQNSQDDLAACDSDRPPVWRRLLRQIVGENDKALARRRQPGNLLRVLLWRAKKDINLEPQSALPVSMESTQIVQPDNEPTG